MGVVLLRDRCSGREVMPEPISTGKVVSTVFPTPGKLTFSDMTY